MREVVRRLPRRRRAARPRARRRPSPRRSPNWSGSGPYTSRASAAGGGGSVRMSSAFRVTAQGYAFGVPVRLVSAAVCALGAHALLYGTLPPGRRAARVLRLVRAGARGRGAGGARARPAGVAAHAAPDRRDGAADLDHRALRPARAGVARALAAGGTARVRRAHAVAAGSCCSSASRRRRSLLAVALRAGQAVAARCFAARRRAARHARALERRHGARAAGRGRSPVGSRSARLRSSRG